MPSFAHDIQPLFRHDNIEAMSWAFDLSKYADVQAHAEDIYSQVKAGTMPCDETWPADRVALFRQWIDEGCAQ
jgi:hypothetical protein